MGDVLDRIVADKRVHVERRRALIPEDRMLADARAAPPPRGFAEALRRATRDGGFGLIAEMKKASPSKGPIREDFDPAALARACAAGGATCLSVLTDEPHFQGADEFLAQARDAARLPVLRKDFMIEPYQIAESRALGADCVLLIMAVLDDERAGALAAAARGLGMDVLFEVHDRAEMERAKALNPELVGINNRNLRTFDVDLATTETLVRHAPEDAVVVGESGLSTPADLRRLSAAGVNCFLVGESLMRSDDVARAVSELLAPAARTPGTTAGSTHFDDRGNARMVDVTSKEETARVATAEARVRMKPETLAMIMEGRAGKGDVLGIARLAGIMAAKRTPDLIPLCHPLPLTAVDVDLSCDSERSAVTVAATCRTTARTGVEMEALTAVSLAALTVYDMCKSVDRAMTVESARLTFKSGGKSGVFEAE